MDIRQTVEPLIVGRGRTATVSTRGVFYSLCKEQLDFPNPIITADKKGSFCMNIASMCECVYLYTGCSKRSSIVILLTSTVTLLYSHSSA